ncbi:lipoate--protein ligase family protein [Natrialbaceae archaeon AArc-T1-2]|uniref:lipoate--protein ligase family protein n=1 Tax=Natrialbaceae archaeon AArc-T1-2 TaxID=3053904 RepID=UPI00255AF593|nr:lipoate--protein ligase family protein [Natrialbaceae archaeon AArc-T1-2]WIV68351.1 lipoate--protein ligase family protein [Natrialbaceae archaeon AArc-T1-2]
MRVFRGRTGTIPADREASARLLEVAAAGEPAVRVWTPHRQVAFGRRDAGLEGYDRARTVARDRGFPPVERSVGGRAVAYDGETTLAFARAEPVADFRRGTDERYERLIGELERALADLGVDVARGEPMDSFCPGAHSLQAEGGKLAGIAQRVRHDAAVVSGVLVVDAADELAGVLEPVYDALAVSFDPGSVGSAAAAGGPADPDRVQAALEDALVGDRETVETCVDDEDGE